ncbi:Protein kinase domain containing protein [Plasmodiophora brassicae]|nr:hypothetical protein PBRA_004992 [Plasmodiophora brassicae]
MAGTQTQDGAWGDDPACDEDSYEGWGRAVSTNPLFSHCALIGNPISFGRHPNCDVRIDNPAVSGAHFRIAREMNPSTGQNLVFIEDTSTNGTFVDDLKIGKGKRVVVTHGSEVTLIPPNKDGTRPRISFHVFFKEDEKQRHRQLQETNSPFAHYEQKELLGQGAYAVVYRCIHRATGNEFALKIIDKKKFAVSGPTRTNALLAEVHILSRLSHPHIIKLVDAYETNAYLYLVLELVTGGELFDEIIKIGRYPEDDARVIFTQMVGAVSYMHEQGIVHRDLKPENVLLRSPGALNIKISDFGLSRIVGESGLAQTLCGTANYLAPEIITAQAIPASGLTPAEVVGYGKAVDMWSLGVILYVILSGTAPFYEGRNTPVFDQIKSGDYSFPGEAWDGVSAEAIDLVKSLLQVDPRKRFTSDQVRKHPWMIGATKKARPISLLLPPGIASSDNVTPKRARIA